MIDIYMYENRMDRCVLGEPGDKETDGGKSNRFPEIPQEGNTSSINKGVGPVRSLYLNFLVI